MGGTLGANSVQHFQSASQLFSLGSRPDRDHCGLLHAEDGTQAFATAKNYGALTVDGSGADGGRHSFSKRRVNGARWPCAMISFSMKIEYKHRDRVDPEIG